jgi:nucleotide-binding universal stress UspA family protein
MRILLATDGTPASSGAVHLAISLARGLDWDVEVLRVLEPLNMSGPDFIYMPTSPGFDVEEGRRGAAAEQIQSFLMDFGPVTSPWPTSVVIGQPAATIVREAERVDASLILLGTGKHTLVSRMFGSETALRVVQLAHVPVVAVPEGIKARPRSLLAATDFSDYSKAAIALAIRLAEPGAELHLAHVLWRPVESPTGYPLGVWNEATRAEARNHLARWAEGIPGIDRVQLTTHLLEGPVAEEVLALQAKLDADMLVAGSHGRGFLARTIVGSVSTRLLRSGAGPLLIAPPPGKVALEPNPQLYDIPPIPT